MKIAIAQINPTVGDLEGNSTKIIKHIEQAKQAQAEIVVFPELVTTGYPPKDLLLKESLITRNKDVLNKIAISCEGIAAVVGFVDQQNGDLFNAAAFLSDQKIVGITHKIHLPNYDVFDEKRYFKQGKEARVFPMNGISVGVNICEDIWIKNGPALEQKKKGADIIINISASPFHVGKGTVREKIISDCASRNSIPIIYANLVGGQDDLIFDGRSYVFNNKGEMIAKAKSFEEDLLLISNVQTQHNNLQKETGVEETYKALVLGLKDYVRKNGFQKVIIGLSGGIDSALTAGLAVAALGKENVVGISMPSHFSSEGSVTDSQKLADNLGIKFEVIPIKDLFDGYTGSLQKQFAGTDFNVAEENIQARIRGNILMAMSNKFGYLVLATGNKSELSVGYATLYGDMSGGLAVISDVMKNEVYQLSEYINKKAGKDIIPESTILKEPSAELREDQRDSDSLPAYNILDPILRAYVEEDKSCSEIMDMGFDRSVVQKVIKLVDRNEYKRQQAALGLKITHRAFGSGRRMPITNRWIENE